jgi:glyoxylase-like metal-dependent hydrolase (beta-lactamase superfamily II)
MNPGIFSLDILLKDGDRVDGLLCVALPGHTPGSIGLYDDRTKTLFSGDILRYDGRSLVEGPAPFTMDLSESRRSIRKLAALDIDLLLPGHGFPLRDRASEKVREFAATLPADA